MPESTKIQWCDHSASPWHGCSKVHAGCDHCYAERQSWRNPSTLGVWGEDGVRVKSASFIGNLRRWQKQAAKAGTTVSVFPSICDPFEDRPELVPWREEMFAVIDECPNVRLLLLTKRPENVRRMWTWHKVAGHVSQNAGDGYHYDYRSNVWIGTSISDQPTADKYVPELLNCRDLTPVLFVSCEPLLGPIDLEAADALPCGAVDCHLGADHERRVCGCSFGVDWVIVGGESGQKSRPCEVRWVRDIVRQCAAASVPCFVKQLGSRPLRHIDEMHVKQIKLADSKGGDVGEWPEDLRVRQFPEAILCPQE